EVNMSRSVLAFGVLFFVSFTIAQTKPANLRKPQSPSAEATSPADVLPVKRVVLYKNGVGYFEHTARVHGTQDLSIDFTSSQLNPATSVRIAERDLNDEVGRYLSLIGSSRARDVRRMALTASGSGDRDVFVSYISEVPIWKSTYRIIFPDKPGEKPLLQGWAIVDNTIGEDWKDVQLSLVAGAPQSFVQNISQPFYTRRPVIALPESVMLTPQSHEASLQVAEPIPASGLGGDVSGGTAGALRAGGVLSSLQGVVKDPAGAVIPGARVTVRNEETGASQVTTTDSRGHYSFSNVQAGNSALFVSSPGFKRYDLSNFYLGVGRTNEIDATLEVGPATETVEVQA